MSSTPSLFDDYVEQYEAACHAGVSLSGESRDYFARERTLRTFGLLHSTGAESPRTVVDFGCGLGDTTPYLQSAFSVSHILGLDVSGESIARARQKYGGSGVDFSVVRDHVPQNDHDLAYCNGVFHHVPPQERQSVVRYVWDLLKPGGWFALWENNPWNPGTRWVMSRIPFDRDAVTLSVRETRRMLSAGGFDVKGARFYFYFPRSLAWFRRLERFVTRVPLGAQYVVLAQKSGVTK